MGNLTFIRGWVNEVQQNVLGTFDAQLESEVIKGLDLAGFEYNPDSSYEDMDGEIFVIAAKAQVRLSGDFNAVLSRAIAKTLAFEGVHKP